uniref:histidine kinase n=1 Tax=Rhodopseudomonas palustris (strain BisA53) TaxID=316055 RepID=Q07H02_RHOP5
MPSADIPDFLRGGGEMGARIAAFDWASTSLGPIALWPPSLKTAVALVVHSAVPLVMLWGEDGVMIYNDAYSVFAGRRHPKLLGSKVREGWPEVADFNDNVMKAGLSGRTLAYRDQKLTLYRHGAPEPVWMNLDYSPVLDESGRPAGVIAIVVETTKRVRADQRIAAEQDRLLSLFDQAPGFMAMLDGPELVFTLANPAYLRLIGHRPAMGRRLRDVLPELRGQGFYEILEHCYRSGEPFVGNSLKVSLQPVQGGPFEDRFVDFVFQPVRDGAGAVTGIFVQGSEVTERVESEVALRRLTETLEARVEERTAELAAANRQLVNQIEERERVEATLRQMQRLEAVGQLTSGVAHDFNNLLTVVLGNLGFIDKALVAAGVDDKSRNRLANIRAAAERGATLTAQLLAFSRKQRLEARAVDLNETLAKMQELLRSSMGGSVRLELVLQPELWPALVDPTQIELVILNLAINARDAMQVGGSLTVETANVRLAAPSRPEMPAAGEYVMIAVSDTGTGMTPEVLAKAFEPFFTTKPVGKGSGLGLAQVFGFAKQSGGGVRIDSQFGEGTTVKVFLPRGTGHLAVADQAGPPEDTLELSGAARRVLLVDDDSAVRDVAASMLREQGCVVVEAGSGGAALDLLERDPVPFDLMVIDFAMPGMTGAEVAREVKLRRPGLPMIFITGYADLAAVKNLGADAIVQKPFRDDELLHRVRRLLGTPRSGNVVPIRK